MSWKDLIQKVEKGEITAIYSFLRKHKDKLIIENQDVKTVHINMNLAFEANNLDLAFRWLQIGLLLDKTKTIFILRRSGSMRSSNYTFVVHKLKKSIQGLLEKADIFELGPDVCSYFESLLNLYNLAPKAKILYDEIVSQIKEKRQNLGKSLLSFIELLLLQGHSANREVSTDSIYYYSLEEIGEGISYLLWILNQTCGTHPYTFRRACPKLSRKTIPELIVKSCKLKKFKEAEVLIDHFHYQVKNLNGDFILTPNEDEFEKARKLGFARTQLQEIITLLKTPSEMPSFFQTIEESCIRLKGYFFARMENPERFVMGIPDHPKIFEALRGFINSEGFYREELAVIVQTLSDHFIDLAKFKQWEIKNNLTFFDIFIVQRYIRFISSMFKAFLGDSIYTEPDVVFNSLVPSFKGEHIADFFSLAILDRNKVDELIHVLSWDPTSPKFFDIQYQPLINSEGYIHVPVYLMSYSNFTRNILSRLQFRYKDNAKDPVVKKLEESLIKTGEFEVFSDIPIKFHGFNTDIDVLGFSQGILFLFECKNSLLPASVFEFRTSYDHIRKGSTQLTGLVRQLGESQFRNYLSTKLKIDLQKISGIFTCIVTGNRMLMGYKCEGHPVRPILELCNFLTSGKMKTKTIDGETDYNLWEGSAFSISDLVNYLGEDHLFHCYSNSMKKTLEVFNFESSLLTFPTYYFDLEIMQYEIGRRFQSSDIDLEACEMEINE